MAMSRDEIMTQVRETLVDALGVDVGHGWDRRGRGQVDVAARVEGPVDRPPLDQGREEA